MVDLIFIGSLLVTFVIARLVAHELHDRQNYGTPYEMSRTITGWLRMRTGFNLHHYHFGIFILVLSILLGSFLGFQGWIVILLGVGISLFLDQISFFMYSRGNYFGKEYFSRRSFFISLIFHLLAVLVSVFFTFA